MRGWVGLLVLWAGSPMHAETDVLPLPKWTEEELRAFREPGTSDTPAEPLLPKIPTYMTDSNAFPRSGPRLEDIPSDLSGDITPRLRIEDLGSFLPDPGNPLEMRPTPFRPKFHRTAPLEEVSPEFLQAAFETTRSEYLIDPDVLIPEMAHLQIMRFLNFHASDARIKLYVLVIDSDKTMPAAARLDRLASGNLITDDACLLVYPLREPWRAKMYLSSSVIEQTSAQFLSETTQSCLRAATQSSDSYDQLQNYSMELSTRLFWLQKALTSKRAKNQFLPLAEDVRTASSTSPEPMASPGPRQPEQYGSSSSSAWLSWLVLLPFLAVSGTGVVYVVRRRRRKNRSLVWILDETETNPRLGGAFAGGGPMVQW